MDGVFVRGVRSLILFFTENVDFSMGDTDYAGEGRETICLFIYG